MSSRLFFFLFLFLSVACAPQIHFSSIILAKRTYKQTRMAKALPVLGLSEIARSIAECQSLSLITRTDVFMTEIEMWGFEATAKTHGWTGSCQKLHRLSCTGKSSQDPLNAHQWWLHSRIHYQCSLEVLWNGPLQVLGQSPLRTKLRWGTTVFQSTKLFSADTILWVVEKVHKTIQEAVIRRGVSFEKQQSTATQSRQFWASSTQTGWGAHPQKLTATGEWTSQEADLHINTLEIKAVFLAL